MQKKEALQRRKGQRKVIAIEMVRRRVLWRRLTALLMIHFEEKKKMGKKRKLERLKMPQVWRVWKNLC